MSYTAQTPRLWLEPLTVESHFQEFFTLWQNPKNLTYINVAPHTNLDSARQFMQTILPNSINPDIDKFAILLRPVVENEQPWTNGMGRPKMIGFVGTNRWSEQGLETGYIFDVEYWGRGYAGEALGAFLGIYWGLIERKGVQKLVAKCQPANIASRKVLMRAGARYEGEIVKSSKGARGEVDLECWYLERPAVDAENLEEGKGVNGKEK
ncbi:hypothetical protein HYFRA_00010288 [Hymenoscyphus fraxineus]|uniref:N-acetyltransferase domain-containing protein n=1 Tax=Hymenoscyphus fraxineus TaxID=746836 RepID=A0A9N9KZH5_9HELO|nr:hypothetical protein HYFRA_00010288 [Hymenoscyphus fraxineus]